MPRQISAVIPVRNNAEDLPAAVQSLLTQAPLTHGVLSEIVLCVGPSDDASLEVAEALCDQHTSVYIAENACGNVEVIHA